MADEAAKIAKAAASAAVAEAAVTEPNRCPVFSGESELESEVLQFIREVDLWKSKLNLSEERCAAWVASSFKGDAKEWYWLQEANGNKDIYAWETLKPLLCERFGVVKTTKDEELKCKPGESLAKFMQRIEVHLVLKYKSMTDTTKKENSIKIMKNKEVIGLFMKGIDPNITKQLMLDKAHETVQVSKGLRTRLKFIKKSSYKIDFIPV